MKIATNIKSIKEVGAQLIIENQSVVGVNILFGKKILLKKRFEYPVVVKDVKEENLLIKKVFVDYFNHN